MLYTIWISAGEMVKITVYDGTSRRPVAASAGGSSPAPAVDGVGCCFHRCIFFSDGDSGGQGDVVGPISRGCGAAGNRGDERVRNATEPEINDDLVAMNKKRRVRDETTMEKSGNIQRNGNETFARRSELLKKKIDSVTTRHA